MREVDAAVCPYCEKRLSDLGFLEVDNRAVGDRMRAVEAAVCPSCGKILGTYSSTSLTKSQRARSGDA